MTPRTPSSQQVIRALLRVDFGSFVRKSFGALCPGQQFVPGFYIDAIVHQLERLHRGEITRLIINMQPRSLKSLIASVAFPAFILGHDPPSASSAQATPLTSRVTIPITFVP
jgi:hypothetical protein